MSLALVLCAAWVTGSSVRAAPTAPDSPADSAAPYDEPFLQGRWETPVGLVRFDYVATIPAVREALEAALPSPDQRPHHPRMAVIHPVLGDRPLGAGQAGRLELHFEDAEPLGPIVDLGNGEYAQPFLEHEGPIEGLLKVTVAGISTDAIAVRSSPTGPPISSGVWAVAGALVTAQVAWLAAVRPRRRKPAVAPLGDAEHPA